MAVVVPLVSEGVVRARVAVMRAAVTGARVAVTGAPAAGPVGVV